MLRKVTSIVRSKAGLLPRSKGGRLPFIGCNPHFEAFSTSLRHQKLSSSPTLNPTLPLLNLLNTNPRPHLVIPSLNHSLSFPQSQTFAAGISSLHPSDILNVNMAPSTVNKTGLHPQGVQ